MTRDDKVWLIATAGELAVALADLVRAVVEDDDRALKLHARKVKFKGEVMETVAHGEG